MFACIPARNGERENGCSEETTDPSGVVYETLRVPNSPDSRHTAFGLERIATSLRAPWLPSLLAAATVSAARRIATPRTDRPITPSESNRSPDGSAIICAYQSAP